LNYKGGAFLEGEALPILRMEFYNGNVGCHYVEGNGVSQGKTLLRGLRQEGLWLSLSGVWGSAAAKGVYS
jgi:hypothetical protein